jgi:hypothetical protein
MNSKFGTSLALAAVLATGTAAAAINTQALNTPTGSNLGTAATTLLPPVDMVAVGTPQPSASVPGVGAAPNSGTATTVVQPETDSSNPVPTTNDPAPTTNDPAPTTNDPVTVTPAPSNTQPVAVPSTSAASPKVVYGNPNPGTGGNDDEGDDSKENDDDEDDD